MEQERSRAARWGYRLALLAAVLAVLAILGLRMSVWDFRLSLLGLVGAAAFGSGAVLLSLFGLGRALSGKRTGAAWSLAGIAIGGVVAAPILLAVMAGSSVPRIHDISTDLLDPPQFEKIAQGRPAGLNALDRAAPPDLAGLQQAGYPGLGPLSVNAPVADVFEAAVALIEESGWELAAASADKGIIEATATTMVMGFKDDLVIRLRDQPDGSTLVDMRSVSQVGESDLGANAKRIGAFLDALDNRLAAR